MDARIVLLLALAAAAAAAVVRVAAKHPRSPPQLATAPPATGSSERDGGDDPPPPVAAPPVTQFNEWDVQQERTPLYRLHCNSNPMRLPDPHHRKGWTGLDMWPGLAHKAKKLLPCPDDSFPYTLTECDALELFGCYQDDAPCHQRIVQLLPHLIDMLEDYGLNCPNRIAALVALVRKTTDGFQIAPTVVSSLDETRINGGGILLSHHELEAACLDIPYLFRAFLLGLGSVCPAAVKFSPEFLGTDEDDMFDDTLPPPPPPPPRQISAAMDAQKSNIDLTKSAANPGTATMFSPQDLDRIAKSVSEYMKNFHATSTTKMPMTVAAATTAAAATPATASTAGDSEEYAEGEYENEYYDDNENAMPDHHTVVVQNAKSLQNFLSSIATEADENINANGETLEKGVKTIRPPQAAGATTAFPTAAATTTPPVSSSGGLGHADNNPLKYSQNVDMNIDALVGEVMAQQYELIKLYEHLIANTNADIMAGKMTLFNEHKLFFYNKLLAYLFQKQFRLFLEEKERATMWLHSLSQQQQQQYPAVAAATATTPNLLGRIGDGDAAPATTTTPLAAATASKSPFDSVGADLRAKSRALQHELIKAERAHQKDKIKSLSYMRKHHIGMQDKKELQKHQRAEEHKKEIEKHKQEHKKQAYEHKLEKEKEHKKLKAEKAMHSKKKTKRDVHATRGDYNDYDDYASGHHSHHRDGADDDELVVDKKVVRQHIHKVCNCVKNAGAAAVIDVPDVFWLTAGWWFVTGARLERDSCTDLRVAADEGWGTIAQWAPWLGGHPLGLNGFGKIQNCTKMQYDSDDRRELWGYYRDARRITARFQPQAKHLAGKLYGKPKKSGNSYYRAGHHHVNVTLEISIFLLGALVFTLGIVQLARSNRNQLRPAHKPVYGNAAADVPTGNFVRREWRNVRARVAEVGQSLMSFGRAGGAGSGGDGSADMENDLLRSALFDDDASGSHVALEAFHARYPDAAASSPPVMVSPSDAGSAVGSAARTDRVVASIFKSKAKRKEKAHKV